jgi:hypothetical protein
MMILLEPLLEIVKGAFANKLIEDDREPIATFELPFVEPGSSVWALFPPKMHLWHQLFMVRCLLACQWNLPVVSSQFLGIRVTRACGSPGAYHTERKNESQCLVD